MLAKWILLKSCRNCIEYPDAMQGMFLHLVTVATWCSLALLDSYFTTQLEYNVTFGHKFLYVLCNFIFVRHLRTRCGKFPKNIIYLNSNYKFDPWFEILDDMNFHSTLMIIGIVNLNLRAIKNNQKNGKKCINLGVIQIFLIVWLLIPF